MSRQTLTTIAIIYLLAVFGLALPASADVLGFGNFSNFQFNQTDSGSPPSFTGSTLHLTSGFGESRTVFDETPQSIAGFTASFVFQAGDNGLTTPNIALIIQNSPQGASAIGTGQFAYVGIHDSVAISLDQILLGGSSGLYENGVVSGGSISISPLDLESGDTLDMSVSYASGRLSETILDTVTSKQFSTTYLANLPSIIGSSTAYFGFGATTGGASPTTQSFSDFQVVAAPTPEPSTWILALLGMAGLFAVAKRRTNTIRTTAGPL